MPLEVQDLCTTIGERIRVARTRRNMTQQDFASRLGTSRQTVQRLEAGDPSVGLGIFLLATWVLGLHRDLTGILAPERDTVGLRDEYRRLPKRAGRRRTTKDDDYDPDKL
jgi:transcriptional regulator with XRE-family HTH domain